MINKTDISKISIAEAISNSNGKTSGSKLGALEVINVGCICLIIATINIAAGGEHGVALAGILAGMIGSALALLGYSKKKATKDTTNTTETEETKEE